MVRGFFGLEPEIINLWRQALIDAIGLLLPDVRSELDRARTSRVSSYQRYLRLENHMSDSCVKPHGFQYR